MYIAEVTPTFFPYYGGMGNVTLEISKILRELGHHPTIITSTPGENVVQEIPIIRYDILNIGNGSMPLPLFKIRRFDVIHLHFPYFFGADIIWLKSLFSRISYFVTYHMDVEFPGLPGYLLKFYYQYILRAILRRSKFVLVSSKDYAKNSSLSKYWSLVSKKIESVPFSINEMVFNYHVKPLNIHALHNIPEDAITLLFVGALDKAHYFKGLPILLKALSSSHLSKFHLFVVGGGRLLSYYKTLANKLNIMDRVTFLGKIKSEVLASYYKSVDYTILPSINQNEAFGIVLVESLACGTPCLASNLPGVRTIINRQGQQLTFNPRDLYSLRDRLIYIKKNRNLVSDDVKTTARMVFEKYYSREVIKEKYKMIFEKWFD